MSYDKRTPDDHTFVRVPHQTGCERCGYARGHHPTAASLKKQIADDARLVAVTSVLVALDFHAGEEH